MAQFADLMTMLEITSLGVAESEQRLTGVRREMLDAVSECDVRALGDIQRREMEAAADHARKCMARQNVQTLLALAWEARNEDGRFPAENSDTEPHTARREIDCPECRGDGQHYSDNGPTPYAFECGACKGTGVVVDEYELAPCGCALEFTHRCDTCRGAFCTDCGTGSVDEEGQKQCDTCKDKERHAVDRLRPEWEHLGRSK